MNYATHELLEESKLNYIPQMALIVYKTQNDQFYIESREIDSQGKMLSAIPLSLECISELAGSFSQEQIQTPHGAIPGNVLYADNRLGYQRYVWYNPPEKRMMYFAKKLNIKDGEYHIPGIVYVVSGSSLNLYAFKGKKPKDKLYNAPFFNTTSGSVCLGNAKIDYPENPSFTKLIKYWEDKFWKTEFTHLGGSQNPTKNNLVTVTKNSKDEFDYKELLKSPTTLKQLIR